MHVAAVLNSFPQYVALLLLGIFGLFYLVRNTASRYFVVDANFDSSAGEYCSANSGKRESMVQVNGAAADGFDSCVVCGQATTKHCAGCKMVKYCSASCQRSHWSSEHKAKCKDLKSRYKDNNAKQRSALTAGHVGRTSKIFKQSKKILFPYEEFLQFFNWDKSGYPPCGLLNCGNSCFANVVLQCLTFTRPLVAYVLEKGHKKECQRDEWCFLCEFQLHVERARRSIHPFSPINILSRLPNIGGNLGHGKQEDAHEFMRFAIDTMQSVCLDEYGGEKIVHPIYQETTLIQHIFGGHLRSQVICSECNNISNQFENMMDLTVEIHGDAGSLEECLDQFTAKEKLHGDNMYKCDGCNAYVMAWKRLTLQRAPNILTIALKRFQSGRFGKLNKRVTFPEMLNLNPYMSESEDGNDVYKLYAVIVHVDMLNASFFGHYICYVKDFCGNWYRIDDCKVSRVDLDDVLSQGAYMLLYTRICARPTCLLSPEILSKEESENGKISEMDSSAKETSERISDDANSVDLEQSSDDLGFDVSGAESSSSTEKEGVKITPDFGVEVMEVSTPLEVASPMKLDDIPEISNTLSINHTPVQFDVHSHASSSSISEAKHETESNGKLIIERTTLEEDGTAYMAGTTSVESLDKVDSNGNGNREISTKAKPLFTRGFLGKQPRKVCNKVGKKVAVEN